MKAGIVKCLAVLLFLAHPVAAQQNQSVALSADELRSLAAQNVVNGNPRLGYDMARALLARDPNDVEALVIRARAARDMGRVDEALVTARMAWRNAKSSNEKFGAAMVMAQALSTSGAQTRSQLWLRRAAQNAPNPELKNAAIRDFRFVRRANPWATELSASVSPNSNINNGSIRETVQLFDLPFEFQLSGAARALSGLQYSYGLSTRYRISESPRNQNDLVFRLNHNTYTMSEEAKKQAPNAKGSDFAYSAIALSYIRRGFTTAGDSLPNQFEVTLGRTLYGKQPFMDYARFGFTQNKVIAPGHSVYGGLSYEHQKSRSTRSDVDIWGLNSGMRQRLQNSDSIALSLGAKRSVAEDAALDYTQISLGVRYALGKPIFGVNVNFGMTASSKSHERSRFSRFGRQDKEVSLEMTGVFSQLEYFGFAPSVTLSARRNTSTIGLYDAEGLGIRVGIQSAF